MRGGCKFLSIDLSSPLAARAFHRSRFWRTCSFQIALKFFRSTASSEQLWEALLSEAGLFTFGCLVSAVEMLLRLKRYGKRLEDVKNRVYGDIIISVLRRLAQLDGGKRIAIDQYPPEWAYYSCCIFIIKFWQRCIMKTSNPDEVIMHYLFIISPLVPVSGFSWLYQLKKWKNLHWNVLSLEK